MRPIIKTFLLTLASAFLAALVPALAYSLEDPTQPYLGSPGNVAPSARMKLSSVLISEERRLAIINGEVLLEGSSNEIFTLARVDRTGVVLRRRGGEIERIELEGANVMQVKE